MENKFKLKASDAVGLCKYAKKNGFTRDKVLTSKDFESMKEKFSYKELAKLNLVDPQFSALLPESGIDKYVLPFTFMDAGIFAMVYNEPNIEVKAHSHTKGFLRTVMFGSYTFTDLPQGEVTLEAGDWIWIPAGQKYGYRTGPKGGGGGCSYHAGSGGQCGGPR